MEPMGILRSHGRILQFLEHHAKTNGEHRGNGEEGENHTVYTSSRHASVAIRSDLVPLHSGINPRTRKLWIQAHRLAKIV